MARAGGGSGGGHSSGGHSSGSRSSGGHSLGGSSRAGSGRSSGGGSRGFGGGHRLGGGPGPFRHHGGGWRHGGRHSCLSYVIAVFVVFWLLGALSSLFFSLREGSGLGSSGIPTNTTDRTAIESGYPYNADCIVDELGWFDDADRTGKKLEDFFKETGVQPYIVLLDYREELTTNAEKLAYAEEYVETHEEIDPYGNTFCYFYFAEENTEQDVGYMGYVAGSMTGSVMDSEAIDIFWAYIDQYWYTDLSTDDMFVQVFNSTSDRIMQRQVTWADVLQYLIIGVIVIAVCVLIIRLVQLKLRRDREKAEETKRILETPIDKL